MIVRVGALALQAPDIAPDAVLVEARRLRGIVLEHTGPNAGAEPHRDVWRPLEAATFGPVGARRLRKASRRTRLRALHEAMTAWGLTGFMPARTEETT